VGITRGWFDRRKDPSPTSASLSDKAQNVIQLACVRMLSDVGCDRSDSRFTWPRSNFMRSEGGQLAGVMYTLAAGLGVGAKESGGFLGVGRGLGSTIAGAGAMLPVASCGTDFRRRISILRR
jgi:hypothetical protein